MNKIILGILVWLLMGTNAYAVTRIIENGYKVLSETRITHNGNVTIGVQTKPSERAYGVYVKNLDGSDDIYISLTGVTANIDEKMILTPGQSFSSTDMQIEAATGIATGSSATANVYIMYLIRRTY